jgi:hypothetical protein
MCIGKHFAQLTIPKKSVRYQRNSTSAQAKYFTKIQHHIIQLFYSTIGYDTANIRRRPTTNF